MKEEVIFTLLQALFVGIDTCSARNFIRSHPALSLLGSVCLNPVDIVFLLDSSSSIDDPSLVLLKSFIQSLVSNFDVEGGAVQVGLVLFSEDVQPAFNLSHYRTRAAIQVSYLVYLSIVRNTKITSK